MQSNYIFRDPEGTDLGGKPKDSGELGNKNQEGQGITDLLNCT